jgi:hypothetical protein
MRGSRPEVVVSKVVLLQQSISPGIVFSENATRARFVVFRLDSLDLSSNLIVGQLAIRNYFIGQVENSRFEYKQSLWPPSFPDWRNEKYRGVLHRQSNNFSGTIPLEIGLGRILTSARFDNNFFRETCPRKFVCLDSCSSPVDCGEITYDCCTPQCTEASSTPRFRHHWPQV